jgi:hypothetical protein
VVKVLFSIFEVLRHLEWAAFSLVVVSSLSLCFAEAARSDDVESFLFDLLCLRWLATSLPLFAIYANLKTHR